MKFWNITLSEELYGGIKIKYEDVYSRKNLRFYVTDKPIGVDGFAPSIEELEAKYRFDPLRQGLREGAHLFCVNMGMQIGIFRLTGSPRPPTGLLSYDGPLTDREVKANALKQAEYYREHGPSGGSVALIIILVLIVLAGAAAAGFFLLRKRKTD